MTPEDLEARVVGHRRKLLAAIAELPVPPLSSPSQSALGALAVAAAIPAMRGMKSPGARRRSCVRPRLGRAGPTHRNAERVGTRGMDILLRPDRAVDVVLLRRMNSYQGLKGYDESLRVVDEVAINLLR